MAQTAWVAMTRATAGRQSSKTARTRVDAGVKELNEMTIGRTDDPENPFGAKAFKAAFVFGLGSRTPSGPAPVLPRQQIDLQSSTVDQNVQRAVRHLRRLDPQQLDRATADRGVIRR
jgi:hypothetical protein